MPYPRFSRARNFKFIVRTAGNYSLNSLNTWANIDTGLDLTIEAQSGDVLAAMLCGYVIPSLSNGTTYTNIDACTLVSGSPLGYFGTNTTTQSGQGVPWWTINGAVAEHGISGIAHYTVQSADVVSGAVTVRLRYQTNVATNQTLRANTNAPLHWSVRNLGPVQPY